MIYLYLILNLTLPLIGLYYIEQGDLGGYPNGSIYPYCFYLASIFFSFKIFGFYLKDKTNHNLMPAGDSTYKVLRERLYTRILFSMVFLILIVLFVFNGYAVILGTLSKGGFRSQMGAFGFVLAIPTKFIFPALFTRICFDYYENKNLTNKYGLNFRFVIFCLLSLFLGLAFGDKSMGVTIIICGIIALLWKRTKFSQVFFLGFFGLAVMVISGYMFDSFLRGQSLEHVLNYLKFRAFSLTAESNWKIWDLHIKDQLSFDYLSTLWGVFGSAGIENLVGETNMEVNAYKYSFAKQVTATLYPSMIGLVNSGHWNITPSAYVEGLVVGGIYGVVFFGILAGFLFRIIVRKLSVAISNKKYALASAIIIYYVVGFMSWIQSGGVTTLFHPITIIGTWLAYLSIVWIERVNIK